MSSRGEKVLLVLVPFVAIVVVAVGLRVGAPNAVRAVVVYGAPSSGSESRLAWQFVAFEEDNRARSPAGGVDIEAIARVGDTTTRWQGRTNQDGVAEAQLAVRATDGMRLEVTTARSMSGRGRGNSRTPRCGCRSRGAMGECRSMSPFWVNESRPAFRRRSGFVRRTRRRTHAWLGSGWSPIGIQVFCPPWRQDRRLRAAGQRFA